MEPVLPGLLAGERIALTGRMASMTRSEAAVLIEAHGAEYTATVGPGTTLLVVGDEGWPLKSNGRLTRKLSRAQDLKRRGQAIEVRDEAGLLRQLGLEAEDRLVCRLYSPAETAHLAGVGRERLRAWLGARLIVPVETRGPLTFFDLRQVIRARSLVALAESGVSPVRLRRSLQQLQRWIPGAAEPLECLNRLHCDGRRLVIEPDDGSPFEPSGQLLFDFREPAGTATLRFDRHHADLFAAAVEHEQRCELETAADAYRELLAREGPDPDVCFNLGNVLYARGDLSAAAERFRQAVELDPEYSEAWHNLGNLLAACGQHEQAVQALRRAVEIDEAYADAHYGLADSLDELGHAEEARPHWAAYLRLGGNGEWANYARQRVRAQA